MIVIHPRQTSVRRPRPGLLAIVAASLAVTNASAADACNIPVFRYALERWNSDLLDVHLLVHDSRLNPGQQEWIDGLQQSTGNLNVSVWNLDSETELPEFLSEPGRSGRPEPWCLIRGSGGAEPERTIWSGPLTPNTVAMIETSPARRQLARMLLQGDSAVWLVIRTASSRDSDSTVQMLTQTLRKLEDETELPDGIGLPGSELYSEVPLMVSFPVLEVDASDPRETFFLSHIRSFLPASSQDRESSTIIVPVFGRGRALIAMTADDLTPATVRDLTTFLCGACSCQVKRMNPGFDLLLDVDWKVQLFGADADAVLPESPATGDPPAIPSLVAIAPGSATADSIPPLKIVPEESGATGRQSVTRTLRTQHSGTATSRRFVWLTGTFVAFVIVGTVLPVVRRQR